MANKNSTICSDWQPVKVFLKAKPKTKMGRMNEDIKSKHIVTATVSISKQQG